MKTKQIPAVIMLLAGLVTCIVAIFQEMDQGRFLKLLLLVLVIFYVVGSVIKVILDKNFKEMEDITEAEEDTSEEQEENEEEGSDSQAEE